MCLRLKGDCLHFSSKQIFSILYHCLFGFWFDYLPWCVWSAQLHLFSLSTPHFIQVSIQIPMDLLMTSLDTNEISIAFSISSARVVQSIKKKNMKRIWIFALSCLICEVLPYKKKIQDFLHCEEMLSVNRFMPHLYLFLGGGWGYPYTQTRHWPVEADVSLFPRLELVSCNVFWLNVLNGRCSFLPD